MSCLSWEVEAVHVVFEEGNHLCLEVEELEL